MQVKKKKVEKNVRNREDVKISQWNGNVYISRTRIVFVGEAGNTKNQNIHAIKICLAGNRDFELITDSKDKGNYYSAVIINAGVTHRINCNGSKVLLLYLLPETQEAKEVRFEFLNNDKDNPKAGVYAIPKELVEESLPFLPQWLQDYSNWDCKKVIRECDNVIRGLGKIRRREISTSSDLADKINLDVKETIKYIYSEIETQIMNSEFDLSRFETEVICKEIKLPLHKKKWLESKFREETSTTIGHYFRDIQMLAALELYAITEAPRRDKEKARKTKLKEIGVEEKDLVDALDDRELTEKERKKIGKLLEEIGELREETPKGTFLTQIAKSLGFGKPGKELDNFNKRIKSRLGINITDLEGESEFFSCDA